MENNKLNAIYAFMQCAKEYSHARVKSAGFSDTEHRICVYLAANGVVSQDNVAVALLMDKTTVAKAMLSLENKGFILRRQNSENRRKNDITLTDVGISALGSSIGVYDEWTDKVCDCLSAEEKKQFFGYCVRIGERAKQINEENKN